MRFERESGTEEIPFQVEIVDELPAAVLTIPRESPSVVSINFVIACPQIGSP